MFGKGAVIVVIGFSMAFSVYQLRLGTAVLSSQDNFNAYYLQTQVHQQALNAVNYGIHQIWDKDSLSGSWTIAGELCTSSVAIQLDGLDTLKVTARSWGYGFDRDLYSETGRAMRFQDSVIAFFTYQTPASRFFWFTNEEGNVYWTSGDSVSGPVHTNGVIRTFGTPVFQGKVTAQQGFSPDPTDTTSLAIYNGGWESGVSNSIPTDLSAMINAAVAGNNGAAINTVSTYDTLLTLQFLDTGEVIRIVEGTDPDTLALSALVPTGVLYSSADIRISGVVDGDISLYTTGNLWIEGDLTYETDPVSNPTSGDLIGMVAQQNIYVSDNAANSGDVTIHGSMIAIDGQFTAENFQTRAVNGQLNITGSVMQNSRGGVGTFSWSDGSRISGFSKNYTYDTRLESVSPPYFPFVRSLKLVAWWE